MAGECIEYPGTRNKDGYGVLPKSKYGTRLAHRVALGDKLGRAVPAGMDARHTCDNPPCVNPEHLLEGTRQDNVNDAVERGRVRGGRYDQTQCKHGHPLTPENVQVYIHKTTLGTCEARRCLTCRRIDNQKQAAKRKAARHARGLLRKRK